MRTTIELPDELFRHVKARAALDGVKLKDLITRYVAQGLGAGAPSPRVEQRPAGIRSPLPVIPKAQSGRPIPALTNAQVQALLDEEDAERANRPAGR